MFLPTHFTSLSVAPPQLMLSIHISPDHKEERGCAGYNDSLFVLLLMKVRGFHKPRWAVAVMFAAILHF